MIIEHCKYIPQTFLKLNPKFIITRFCHGSGGKFLSTVLQSHPQIQHWTHWLEKNKNDPLFIQLVKAHAQRSFPKNHSHHLRSEPIAPYDTTLWSSTYARGEELELSDLRKYYQQTPDRYLEDAIKQDLWINIIFNKMTLPKFCSSARIVTLMIDNQLSLNWVQKSLWQKHFIEDDHSIIYCPNHPLYCPEESVPTVIKYNNQCEFDIGQKNKLLQQHIIDNPMLKEFALCKFDSQNNHTIPVSALFDLDRLLDNLDMISRKWHWVKFDPQIVSAIHQSWIDSQIPYWV